MPQPTFQTLECTVDTRGVADLWIARPEVHNAFNEIVIAELATAFGELSQRDDVRVVCLRGQGRSFSAGADIEWMRAQGEADAATNEAGALRMAAMFRAIHECTHPVVAVVHGAALGGGTGLCAASDIAIAGDRARFGFTEVRLGILPAVIAPYAIERIGLARARALFLLGDRFDGREAERIGLVHRCVADEELEAAVAETVASLLAGSPAALRAAKRLVQGFALRNLEDDAKAMAREIASIRGSGEAREGLTAFLDKRAPSWRQS